MWEPMWVAAKLAKKLDGQPLEFAQILFLGRTTRLVSGKSGEAFVALSIVWRRKS